MGKSLDGGDVDHGDDDGDGVGDDGDYDDDGGDDDEVRETGEVLMSCPTSKETRNRHNSSDPPTPPHRISSPVVPHFLLLIVLAGIS